MMTYLPNNNIGKRRGKNKLIYVGAGLLVLGLLFYFRGGFAYIATVVFKPLLSLRSQIEGEPSELEKLKQELANKEAQLQNYQVLWDENNKLKDVLSRKNKSADFILASILAKPGRSPYDTLLIDVGADENIFVGKGVYANGNIPIGKIAEVYPNTSKVVLFSSPGEKTEAIVGGRDIFTELVGRGGGNFEVTLPREITIERETAFTMPGITPYVVAVAQATISDPRDAFTKVLLVSPVNFFELKFVQVEK